VIDAEQVRQLAETAALRLVDCPTVTPGGGSALSAVGGAGPLDPVS
jgi:hypothetical protein